MAQPNFLQLTRHFAPLQKLTRLDATARTTADNISASMKLGKQIPSLTLEDNAFNKTRAYDVSATFASRRLLHDKQYPVGRKIGFTNQKIWSEYNVNEPIWGYLWEQSTHHRRRNDMHKIGVSFRTMAFQPRIEPEIILGLSKRPHSSMTEKEALSCVDWVAHGFELVISLFKDWKFTVADAVATNALHKSLVIGTKLYLADQDPDAIVSQLKNFTIDLYVNDKQVDSGAGSNVLGSPIKALLYLCEMLENQTLHPQLMPGEIIATGTLTKAMPIGLGDQWSTRLEGIDLQPMSLKINRSMLVLESPARRKARVT